MARSHPSFFRLPVRSFLIFPIILLFFHFLSNLGTPFVRPVSFFLFVFQWDTTAFISLSFRRKNDRNTVVLGDCCLPVNSLFRQLERGRSSQEINPLPCFFALLHPLPPSLRLLHLSLLSVRGCVKKNNGRVGGSRSDFICAPLTLSPLPCFCSECSGHTSMGTFFKDVLVLCGSVNAWTCIFPLPFPFCLCLNIFLCLWCFWLDSAIIFISLRSYSTLP